MYYIFERSRKGFKKTNLALLKVPSGGLCLISAYSATSPARPRVCMLSTNCSMLMPEEAAAAAEASCSAWRLSSSLNPELAEEEGGWRGETASWFCCSSGAAAPLLLGLDFGVVLLSSMGVALEGGGWGSEERSCCSQPSGPSRFVMDLRQCRSQASWWTSKPPPSLRGRDSRGMCWGSWGIETVKTRSRSFSRTNRRRILKGALNHSGAVTIRTFFSLAG